VSVRVSGSALIPADAYSVKLEGAELVGYQSIIVGGIRDAVLIKQLDSWLVGVRERIEKRYRKDIWRTNYRRTNITSYFIFTGEMRLWAVWSQIANPFQRDRLVLEATAPTQEIATTIALLSRQPSCTIQSRSGKVHHNLRMSSQSGTHRSGAVYRFNFHHVRSPAQPGRNVPHRIYRHWKSRL